MRSPVARIRRGLEDEVDSHADLVLEGGQYRRAPYERFHIGRQRFEFERSTDSEPILAGCRTVGQGRIEVLCESRFAVHAFSFPGAGVSAMNTVSTRESMSIPGRLGAEHTV